MRTTGKDIFKILGSFTKADNLLWSNCVGICTNGAPSMVGSIKGLLAKKENKKIFTHCFLYRENLFTKPIGNKLKEVMDRVVCEWLITLNVGLVNHNYLQKFVKKWEQSFKMFYYS